MEEDKILESKIHHDKNICAYNQQISGNRKELKTVFDNFPKCGQLIRIQEVALHFTKVVSWLVLFLARS